MKINYFAMLNMRSRLARFLQPRGKTSFLMSMVRGAKVLDVGCGNDSPTRTKKCRPDLYYIGLDIDHSNTGTKHGYGSADQIYLTNPNLFHEQIEVLSNSVDYVISSHNLEHCNSPELVLRAMVLALKTDGMLYLSFPSISSQNFPHRRGPLNYYDEKEHIKEPPHPEQVLKILKSMNCEVQFMSARYRPILLFMLGILLEIPSRFLNRTLPGTWQLYGFESIIWARKRS